MALVFDLVMFGDRLQYGRLTTTVQWPRHVRDVIDRDYAPPRIVFDLYDEPVAIAFAKKISAGEIRSAAASAAKRLGVRLSGTRPPAIYWHFKRSDLEVSVLVASREQPKGAGT